jgi:DNA modification methylase
VTGILVQGTAHALPFPSGHFHSAVFSPPYFGLRTYHGEQDILWPGGYYRIMAGNTFHEARVPEMRRALGSETFVEDYVWHMLLVCREVKRVLREDGVLWLNIADSYNGSGGAGGDYNEGGLKEGQPKYPGHHLEGLKPGDAIGIPWRLAFALQADGWTLRGVPLWVKDSVMPEPIDGWRWQPDSCTCTTDRREASIREQMAEQGVERHRVYRKAGDIGPDPKCPKCKGSGYEGPERLRQGSWRHTRSYEQIFMLTKGMGYWADRAAAKMVMQTDANPRDILRPARSNYKGEHFATYPPSLVVPLIAATVPRHACPACGMGWSQSYTTARYRPSCSCDDPREPVAGRVLDPFIGSGSTALAAEELGVDWAGLDISRQYLREEAAVRVLKRTPVGRLDDLPLFGGLL